MATPVPTPRAPARLAMTILLSSFLACGSSPKSLDKGSAEITVYALTAIVPTTVKLAIQSPSVLPAPLRLPLSHNGDQFQAIINNLSVANDFVFTAEALDPNGTMLAHGVAAGVVISRGKTAKIIIYMSQLEQTPVFHNSSPLVDAITLSTNSVRPGGNVSIAATAHDPDAGQTATLLFTWLPAGGCGEISEANTVPGTDGQHPSQSRATWSAPQALGDCQITLTVTDSLQLSNSASFTIAVANEVNEAGTAVVEAVFNGAPTILGITADPAQISAGGTTTGVLVVQATDPESDSLTYAWSTPADSPCTIDFGTPSEASTPFTINTTAEGATSCTFLVAVSDGPWPETTFIRNKSTASATLAITQALVVRLPPDFGIAYQSEDRATAGRAVMFGAIAFDPAGGELTFEWAASAGSAPVAADPVSLNLDRAFSTASTWTVPPDAESATSDLVVSVTATSSVTALQSSFTFSLAPGSQP